MHIILFLLFSLSSFLVHCTVNVLSVCLVRSFVGSLAGWLVGLWWFCHTAPCCCFIVSNSLPFFLNIYLFCFCLVWYYFCFFFKQRTTYDFISFYVYFNVLLCDRNIKEYVENFFWKNTFFHLIDIFSIDGDRLVVVVYKFFYFCKNITIKILNDYSVTIDGILLNELDKRDTISTFTLLKQNCIKLGKS